MKKFAATAAIALGLVLAPLSPASADQYAQDGVSCGVPGDWHGGVYARVEGHMAIQVRNPAGVSTTWHIATPRDSWLTVFRHSPRVQGDYFVVRAWPSHGNDYSKIERSDDMALCVAA